MFSVQSGVTSVMVRCAELILFLYLQARYQKGTLDMLDAWFAGRPFDAVNYIVRDGKIAPQYL